MTSILDLSVNNDETLNNIITGNPYYIDIKGSVNICTIRCGQKIDQCNEVVFSTMTNYGKILVLNPNKNTKSKAKCSIKLAFDNNNDNIGINGDGNYVFEKAFITVPSLHKLNGQIYDMETFLLFSSTQKNGNILYVCICTFSTGTSTVPKGDKKLLNYKLMNELFSKNVVPDIYGTNQIKGRPNPVDLSNFIPPNGLRNFYDYTHPLNNKVNFRVHQEIMYVSNDVLTTLKSKLTPGNNYNDFKSAISKTINPFEGLFFYFSEDLTNRYKSFKQNQVNEESKESFDDQEKNEKDEKDEKDEKEFQFKKLEYEDKDSKKDENDDIGNKEKFTEQEETVNDNDSQDTTFLTSNNAMSLFFIIGFLLVANCLNTFFLSHIFTKSNGISESDLPNYLSEISNPNNSNLIGTKFKLFFNIFLQAFFSLILFILIPIFISTETSNKNIYTMIILLMVLLLLNVLRTFILNINFLFFTLCGIYDKDFIQKQNYFNDYINSKIYKGSIFKIIYNLFKYSFSNNYDQLLSFSDSNNNIMSGGANGDLDEGAEEGKSAVNFKRDPVPGSNNKLNEDIKMLKQKEEISKISSETSALNPLGGLMRLFSLDFIQERFKENPAWSLNLKLYLFIIFIFFIIGSLLDLTFISKTSENGIKFLVSSLIVIVSFFPLLSSVGLFGCLFVNNNKKAIIALFIFTIISLILSFFGMPFLKSLPEQNWIYWIIIICIFANFAAIFIARFMPKSDSGSGFSFGSGFGFGSGSGPGPGPGSNSTGSTDSSAPSMEDYLLLQKQLEQQKMIAKLYEKEIEESSDSRTIASSIGGNIAALEKQLRNKNKTIEELKSGIQTLIVNLNKYKLSSVKNLLNSLIDIFKNETELGKLKSEKSTKDQLLKLLDSISKNDIENEKLKEELKKLQKNNGDQYKKFIEFLTALKGKIEA